VAGKVTAGLAKSNGSLPLGFEEVMYVVYRIAPFLLTLRDLQVQGHVIYCKHFKCSSSYSITLDHRCHCLDDIITGLRR